MNKELTLAEKFHNAWTKLYADDETREFLITGEDCKVMDEVESKLNSYSKYEGKSVVIQCRKCGHLLYVDINDKLLKHLADIENIECPTCGEEGFENWVVRGVDDFKKRKIY